MGKNGNASRSKGNGGLEATGLVCSPAMPRRAKGRGGRVGREERVEVTNASEKRERWKGG